LNTHYTYFLILGCSLLGPLALSFDKKVAFYTKWKALFPAMVLPALFYIVWDIYFTSAGIWQFNDKYITGIRIFNLPLEEALFFLVVPYCCVFVYECIRCYFPKLKTKPAADLFLKCLAIILLLTALFFHSRLYTSLTFLFNAVFILLIYIFRKYFKSFDAIAFLMAYLLCLIPFLIVNGYLTAIPVVIYDNAENLGLRIFTIPFEDLFYGMLLVLLNVCFYEKKLDRAV
jgi:lycopene cyclase domain-containing protein